QLDGRSPPHETDRLPDAAVDGDGGLPCHAPPPDADGRGAEAAGARRRVRRGPGGRRGVDRGERQDDRDLPRHLRRRARGPPGVPPVVIALRRLGAAAVFLAAAATLGLADDSPAEKATVVSRGRERTVWVFVPPGVSAEHPAPLVVAFHGSGGSGRTM